MNNIKQLRQKAGMTQVELADRLDVAQSCVSMWEIGINMPRADMLPKISKILNCKIEDLYRDPESEV